MPAANGSSGAYNTKSIFFFSKRRNTVNILCRNIDTNGVLRNTAVARRAVQLRGQGALFQFAQDGVLAPAAAYTSTFMQQPPFSLRPRPTRPGAGAARRQ